jgi:hypothetical protein
LATGGVINWNNGDVTATHAANSLAFAGASSGYTFDALVTPAATDGAALGSGTVMWSDLFLASGAVLNFNNGDVTVTHSTNNLAFAGAAGATLGYSFDNNIILGTTVAGATAEKTLCLHNSAVAPTASADMCHLFSADTAGAATNSLAVFQELAPAIDVIVNSTHSWRITINGTVYRIHMSTV